MTERHQPLYSAVEMRAAEERYPGYPDTIPELMDRAGGAVAREAMLAYPGATRFACVCGGGSNGGDGRVAARVLREAGHVADEVDDGLDDYDVVIDALFGTGFHGAPRPETVSTIERINASPAAVVSVDVPSGVDASTGEIAGAVVDADLTVTFHAAKVGLVVAPGRFKAGWVAVAGIGLEHAPTEIVRATPAMLDAVPRRGERDTKYSSGAVVVVGGGRGMTGAACLSAMAALRADAGYVTLAVPDKVLATAEAIALEPVKVGWSEEDAIETIVAAAERAAALALGPGLGRGSGRRELVQALLDRIDLPAVVDADALFDFEPVSRVAATVLTPHAGELARLLGRDSEWVGEHRLEAARTAAERVRRDRASERARHARRVAGGSVTVCDQGISGARDGRHGRRPHGRHCRIPRKGTRRGDGGRGRGGCAWARRAAHPTPGRNGRERSARNPSRGPRSLTAHVAIAENGPVERSCFTLDLGAIRRNAEILLRAAGGAELWAVVKAEGYGHGAVDVSKAALDAGATALCVATLPEALHLRAALRNARIVVMGPVSDREVGEARVARLELVAADGRIPDGVKVHLKLDTGMGRWGLSELPAPTRDVVGVMSHLASAEADPCVHAAAGRSLPRGHGAARIAHPASGEQRRDPAVRRSALRRRAVWHRALRDLSVRGRPRRTRS